MALLRITSTKLAKVKKACPTASILLRGLSAEPTNLKSVLQEKIPKEQEKIRDFRKKHGNTKVGEVTIDMMYSGMRGITGLIWETSVVDAEEGVRFRGMTIPECVEALPKAKGSDHPLPEGIFWLLLTGDVPTEEQANALSKEWAQRSRSNLPSYLVTMLKNMPINMHPLAQLSASVTTLQSESIFMKAYSEGIHKSKYWEYVYEDCMNLIAKLPVIASTIYRNTYHGGKGFSAVDENKDWSANYCAMHGFDDPHFIDLMRLELTLYCDHEGGNVSAHTSHLVGSALSDPYLSFAAGLNALAGPLHGRAIEEVVIWVDKLRKEIGDNYTEEQLKEFIWKTLKSGQVVPGYGHGVLRKTDPRYTCLQKFVQNQKHLQNEPLVKLAADLYKAVPPILMELGKVKNPWPNVDAYSGILLQHYGLKEMDYYTMFLAMSRSLGVLAQMVWSRALGLPIERPKSLSTDMLIKKYGK